MGVRMEYSKNRTDVLHMSDNLLIMWHSHAKIEFLLSVIVDTSCFGSATLIRMWMMPWSYTINLWCYDIKISEVNSHHSAGIKPELLTWAMLCHWAATTRKPVALAILYMVVLNLSIAHQTDTQYVPSELCYVETSIWKKCTLSGISGFDSLATADLPLSWIFTSKHIFVLVD